MCSGPAARRALYAARHAANVTGRAAGKQPWAGSLRAPRAREGESDGALQYDRARARTCEERPGIFADPQLKCLHARGHMPARAPLGVRLENLDLSRLVGIHERIGRRRGTQNIARRYTRDVCRAGRCPADSTTPALRSCTACRYATSGGPWRRKASSPSPRSGLSRLSDQCQSESCMGEGATRTLGESSCRGWPGTAVA